MSLIRVCLASLLLAASLPFPASGASEEGEPDKDESLAKLLTVARRHIDDRQPAIAIEKCDKVIAAFEKYYANGEHKVYCARSSPESLGYLVKAGAAASKGEFERGKKDAIVLSGTWAEAYFLKSFALQDLGRVSEAEAAINQALELSPWCSLYLSELGSIYTLEKNWPKAREVFKQAEENAGLSPENQKAAELGQARRGAGYVLVELGLIAEAEKKYRQCLTDDPADNKAKAELDYIRDLKAKKNGK